MTGGSINHTLSGFSSSKRYIAVFFDESYGGHAMGDGSDPPLVMPLEVHEMTFTGAIPYANPDIRGDWNVAETNISRTHLESVPDDYTIVLDSEPLSDVVITPVVQDHIQLASWDKFNSSFNQEYSEVVTTGRYHTGNRVTRIATSLHFNASTWHIPQTVLVSAVDNNVAQGNRMLSVSHTSVAHKTDFQPVQQKAVGNTEKFSQDILALRSQYRYGGIDKYHTVSAEAPRLPEWPRAYNKTYKSNTGKVVVDIAEDDKAGVSVSESHIYVTEGSSNGTFAVVLDSEPTAEVTVNLLVAGGATGDQLQILVKPNVLVFNAQSWSVPQVVEVSAHDDDVYEGRYGFTQVYSRYIPQPFAERILLDVRSDDGAYNEILIGQNEPDRKIQYVRDQSIEVTVIDDDGGCRSEYKCKVAVERADEFTPEGICVTMDSDYFQQNFNPEEDSIPEAPPGSTDVCVCPQGYGMRDCSLTCAKSSLCEFRRIHFIVECNEKGVCTKSGGLNKASFVTELARAILLYNARLMEQLDWPAGATQTAFKGVDYTSVKSPSLLVAAKIEYDSSVADKGNQPIPAPTRMPTPAPTAPTTAPTATPTEPTPSPGTGSYDTGSYGYSEEESSRRLLEAQEEVLQTRTASESSHADSRRLQNTETDADAVQPLTIDSVWDSFYVVRSLPTQCMFSFTKKCRIVTVDVKDGTGELTQFLLQSERAGHFSSDPVNMQYAQQADTLDHSGQMIQIMWTIVGFVGFAFLCMTVYKVYKSFVKGTKKMTAAEKRAWRESQQIW